jgi:phenylacetate-CoA ligase
MQPGNKPDRHYLSYVDNMAFPAMPDTRSATMLAVLKQLDESQWWSTPRLLQAQHAQLLCLLRHAFETVPYYRQILSSWPGMSTGSGQMAWSDELWCLLPVLSRKLLQDNFDPLISKKLPSNHGKTYKVQSSGSTGRPVQVLSTDVTRFYWNISTLRENDWHQHDYLQKFAAVRPDRGMKDTGRAMSRGWGAPVDWLYHSAPMLMINSRVDILQQLEWLLQYQPVYLLSLPSNIRALLDVYESQPGRFDGLKQVRSFGETVSAELRERVTDTLGVKVADMYSSQEVGYMALQCPEHDHYHVQSETMYVEVLDEDNRPCSPGEIGRVVVTPLHNYATPLLRYEVGDYAEVGEACRCGRGLPVLSRIVGRTRNMLRTPDGKISYPSFPVEMWKSVADIRQFQLHQVALDTIQVTLVVTPGLGEAAEHELREKLCNKLMYPFNIIFNYVDDIPVQANGKYEDFISLL